MNLQRGRNAVFYHEGVYQARKTLCERLGEDEDADVEIIINNMEKISRLLAMKMFEYGKCETEVAI